MKRILNYAIIIALVPLFILSSCKKDEDPEPQVDKFETLKDYMVANNMDLSDILTDWITTADAVNGKAIGDYYFIDIRSEADFNAGHINGAVNANYGNLLEKAAASGGKPIIVVCYTGQSAGHATVALRLSGYPTAKVLKWGMSGWNSALSTPWNDNTGSDAIGHTNFAAAPGDIAPSINFNKFPTINSTHDDGANILMERVAALLEGGFKGVGSGDVVDNPSNYCINNFWDEADVTEYGNIKTAYRVKPLTLAGDQFKYLDPDATVVTYCWTGQTSSMITAYLTVMGYDAKSLTFGANGMIYDNLHSHKWAEPTTNYDVVSGK